MIVGGTVYGVKHNKQMAEQKRLALVLGRPQWTTRQQKTNKKDNLRINLGLITSSVPPPDHEDGNDRNSLSQHYDLFGVNTEPLPLPRPAYDPTVYLDDRYGRSNPMYDGAKNTGISDQDNKKEVEENEGSGDGHGMNRNVDQQEGTTDKSEERVNLSMMGGVYGNIITNNNTSSIMMDAGLTKPLTYCNSLSSFSLLSFSTHFCIILLY